MIDYQPVSRNQPVSILANYFSVTLQCSSYTFHFTVDWKWCISLISTSGTYIWSGDWRMSYISWGFNRILARGKVTRIFFISKQMDHVIIWLVIYPGSQITDWRHWGAETYYFLCRSSSLRKNLFRYFSLNIIFRCILSIG